MLLPRCFGQASDSGDCASALRHYASDPMTIRILAGPAVLAVISIASTWDQAARDTAVVAQIST